MRQVIIALFIAGFVFALPARAQGRSRAVRPAQRILWIGAHPDDEILIAPLLGRECVERGAYCAMLVMTRGEGAGSAAVRVAEMQSGAEALRAHLTLWTFSDVMSSVDAVWSAEVFGRDLLLGRIAAEIVAHAPTAIYTFDPTHGSTCHPAHRAIGQLVIEAVRRTPVPPPVILVETAAKFESSGFTFRNAVAQAVMIDATTSWSYLVRDAELHASQFSAAQIENLRNTPVDQRRIYLLNAQAAAQAIYNFTCP